MEKKTNKESDNKSNRCPKCRARLKEDDLFCPDCGAKIISKEVKEEKPAILGVISSPDSAHNRCSKCRAEISKDLSFCPKCGAKQIANCSKCGAKLNKTDTFCTSCGHKLEKPATFASNSLTSGIFALFLGWIPIIGWILIIFALVYGFLSLNRIKKGNTLESRRMAIAGIVLGFIALAIALSVSIYYMYGDGTNDSTSGIFGPSDAETTSVLKMSPVISQFMEEHPKAITHFYHYSLSEFDVNKNDILFYCNHDSAFIKKTTIEPAEYSLATMTDKESKLYIIAFINWDDMVVECAVKGDATEEDIIEPPSQEEILPNAEKKFEETVCNAIPDQAMHMAMGSVSIPIPLSLDDELEKMGDSMTFTFPNEIFIDDASGERYYSKYSSGWVYGGGQDKYVMVIPITADLADENGNNLVTENGGIKLTFEGALEPLKVNSITKDTEPRRPSTPIQTFFSGSEQQSCPSGNTCVYEPVPTFSRTKCEVDFEQTCLEKEGYNLAGQCHYADFYGDITDDWRIVDNLGQCRYCPSGSKGNWGVLGICGEGFSCISGGDGRKVSGQYYVSCSECRTTPPSSSYSGGSYEWCNYYYNACVQSGCGKILDNCR